jgi:hypothetical protein
MVSARLLLDLERLVTLALSILRHIDKHRGKEEQQYHLNQRQAKHPV